MDNRKLTAEDIKVLVKENDIDFIRLQFVDIFGTLKNLAITKNELDKALNNEIMFDGSSIEGFVRIEESDMFLYPDPSTFEIIPWYTEYKIARMICDIYRPDRTPFDGDPRFVLKKAISKAKDMGYDFYVGPECEFFLFQTDETGRPTTKTHDNASYFDLAPVDHGENARIDMVSTMQKMGFQIEAAHHESAPGQHEIDFKYSDALNAADNIVTFKLVVKVMAQKRKLHATFMPKPVNGVAGSGMHCNMSLYKDGENAFYDESDSNNLSQIAYYFIGGLLKHAKGMAAITNPIVNSYKRLMPGYEAPVYIAWSTSNRSPLIRIPSARGSGTRIELRNPDPSSNPYLALAAMLSAGMDGIENKILPPVNTNENIFIMSNDRLQDYGIDRLPFDLNEALTCLRKDELIKDAIGAHVLEYYMKAKEIEWEMYSKKVHQWELENYISKY